MDPSCFAPIVRRRRLAAAFLLAMTAALPVRLLAKGCAESLGPAQAPPQALWGDLKPGSILIDATNWTGSQLPSNSFQVSTSVDVENGWVYQSHYSGFSIWDARSTPATPQRVALIGGFNGGIPGWPPLGEFTQVVFYIDAPEGVDNIMALGAMNPVGLTIWDTTTKTSPRELYQDKDRSSYQVYAARIGGRDYVFAADFMQGNTGLHLYDMTAARAFTSPCQAQTQSCPGVYLGRIGGPQAMKYVHGLQVGSRHFVVTSGGDTAGTGIRIWEVTNPQSPVQVVHDLQGFPTTTHGVAMWSENGRHYLAARQNDLGKIFDVTTCLTTGCSNLSSLQVWQQLMKPYPESSYWLGATFSRSGSKPFVFFGNHDTCRQGNVPGHTEYLMDVSNPAQPVDVMPGGTIQDLGVTVDYWSWYNSDWTRGWSHYAPRVAKFNGQYLYRAAATIFDVHQYVGSSGPPVANFSWNPAPAYAGDPVTFTSTSTGSPTSYQWSFQDGSPSSGSASSVQTTFGSPGNKSVTLTVTNSQALSDDETKTVSIIDPAPAVGSVSTSPAAPLACQPVTFTANNVTGKPTLTIGWTIFNSLSSPVATGSGNPFTWNSIGQPSGAYSATVTVSRAGYPDATSSAPFALGALPPLPAEGMFPPINDPFAAGTVNFHVAATGATEWKWDFGDGTPQVWSSDPISGPNPTHTYSQTGDYNVKVYVKNCVEGGSNGVGSSILPVHVSSVQPLQINVFQAFGCQIFCDFQVNQSITFTQEVVGTPTSYEYDWDGNGSFEQVSATKIDTHTYTSVGLYLPVLRVKRGSESTTLAHAVVINIGTPAPASTTVSGPGSGQINQSYSFTASGNNCTPGGTWTWNGGGGAVTGTGSTVTISWTTAGTKTVSASSANCPLGTTSMSIGGGGNSSGGLTPAFTFSPASPQPNQAVTFDGTGSGGSPQVFLWEFGGGATALTPIASRAFPAGTYQVKLTVSKDCSVGICNSQASITKTVVVAGPTLTASFDTSATCSIDITGPRCDAEVGQVVSFTYTGTGGATSHTWSFDDGSGASGPQVTHSWSQPGSRNVVLTVGNGSSTATFSRLFQVSGPALPPLVASFTTTPACTGAAGAEVCAAVVGQTVELRSTSTGDPTAYAWSFGDGSTATGANTSHAWSSPGSKTVTLTVTRGTTTASAEKRFTIAAVPLGKRAVLPWVIQNNNADHELSDLYLYNPGPGETHLTIRYHNKGVPSSTPPQLQRTLAAGQTAQVLALLGQFNVDNTSGFISVEAAEGDPQPMAMGFHLSFDGTRRFGQVLPGYVLGDAPASPVVYHLIGLQDTADRGTTFGTTNPGFSPASYSLRFFDSDGILLGSRPSTALPGSGQEQLDRTAQQALGVNNEGDYRIEVEVGAGSTVFPFAATRWASSEDPGLVVAQREGGRPRQYLLGMFNGPGARSTQWSSDAVLVNPTDQPMTVTLSFVSAVGKSKKAPPARTKQLQPGQTLRLADILWREFKVKVGAGVVIVDSAGVGGVYPLVLGDTYSTAGTKHFGQLVPSVDDRSVAATGRVQVLLGLQEDGAYKTTMWLHNAQAQASAAELTFRKLDGTVLSRLVVNVGGGKALQVPARVNKGLPKGFSGAFSVEVKVTAGQLYAGAQVFNKGTNDPAFGLGQLRP